MLFKRVKKISSMLSVHLQRVRSSMDHSDCSEQTCDDSGVLYTSHNVGSAYKQICFQSNLPFSILVPRLKYIMVQPMRKGRFCSSGRGGDGNEGGIAEAFCGATKRSLARGERRFTPCMNTHTIFIQQGCKWLERYSHPAEL